MKRFHSNLQKVFDLCQQQSRMAEIELARAKAAWVEAQQAQRRAEAKGDVVREEVNQALCRTRQSTMLMGLHQHLAAADDEIQIAAQQTQQMEQQCRRAHEKYQELHSRVQRLERLMERQKAAFRKDQQREQQKTIDDIAIFRWTHQPAGGQEVTRHG